MLRLKPFLFAAFIIAGSIAILGVLHRRIEPGSDAGIRAGVREELGVGFLPVT